MDMFIFERYHSRQRPAITTASISLTAPEEENHGEFTAKLGNFILFFSILILVAHFSFTTHTKKIKLHDKTIVLFEEEQVIHKKKLVQKKKYFRPENAPVKELKKERKVPNLDKILPKKEEEKNIFLNRMMTAKKFRLETEKIDIRKANRKKLESLPEGIKKKSILSDKTPMAIPLKKAELKKFSRNKANSIKKIIQPDIQKNASLAVKTKADKIQNNPISLKPKFHASLSSNSKISVSKLSSAKGKAFRADYFPENGAGNKKKISLKNKIDKNKGLTANKDISQASNFSRITKKINTPLPNEAFSPVKTNSVNKMNAERIYASAKHKNILAEEKVISDTGRLKQKIKSETDIRKKVIFHNNIEGDNLRVDNLRRTILDKISNSKLSTNKSYCIKISRFSCKIKILSYAKDKISIYFYPNEKIPFKILSKLERKIPQGLNPCN